MDKINDFVLESEVAILSGGVDHEEIPLITIPTDCADLVDIYGTRDILRLLQLYVRIAGGKAAVLVDLQNGWTEKCISKLTGLIDELQKSLHKCLTTLYVVKPRLGVKQKILHREPSTTYGPGHMTPFYKVQRLENHDELHYFVDKHQVTKDYGGTLRYDHREWMDFHKRYYPLIETVEGLLDKMPVLQDEVDTILKSAREGQSNLQKEGREDIEVIYETLLGKRKVRETIKRCEQTIVELESQRNDPNAPKIHGIFIDKTIARLRKLNNELITNISDMNAKFDSPKSVDDIYIRLRTCQESANEVKETIDLLSDHMKGLPRIGNNIAEAYKYRQDFIEDILKPSEEIAACSTLILKQLDTGKETTQKSYASSFEIAKQLTESLQPFTQEVNKLNDSYTRLHLFFMLLIKVKKWAIKASGFMVKHLQTTTLDNEPDLAQMLLSDKYQRRVSISSPLEELDIGSDGFVNALNASNANLEMRDEGRKLVTEFPDEWTGLLEKFYRKHPPPRRKHLRLLTRSLPTGIKRCLKTTANNLVERTIFIISLLDKSTYKTEDISLIETWQREHTRLETTATPTGIGFSCV